MLTYNLAVYFAKLWYHTSIENRDLAVVVVIGLGEMAAGTH